MPPLIQSWGFLSRWRLKCRAGADSIAEASERLLSFIHLHPALWKAVRTTNTIQQRSRGVHRRIKTRNRLPSAETVPMLFRALLAPTQIQMGKVGWTHLYHPIQTFTLDVTA